MNLMNISAKNLNSNNKRKPNRLAGYDYSLNGAYFVTICTAERKNRFRKVGANCVRPGEFQLTPIGEIVKKEIEYFNTVYTGIAIDKYTIMPNHIHLIISLSGNDGRTQFAPTLSRMIKQFKGSVSKQIGYSIWQKSFYDRIIRNENEYLKIWEYIENNPLSWENDELYIEK